ELLQRHARSPRILERSLRRCLRILGILGILGILEHSLRRGARRLRIIEHPLQMTSTEASSSHRPLSSGAHLVGIEVLVLDGDDRVHAGIEQLLSEAQLHVTCVADPDRAQALVDRQFFSVALIDIDTPAPRAGIETIRAIKHKSPTSMVIAMTPRRSYDDAVDAVRAGAIDLILKAPDSVAYLKERVLDAAGRSVGKREVDSVLDDVRGVHEDFLQRFMDAERRAIDLADKVAGRDSAQLSRIDELRVLVIDAADEFFAAMAGGAAQGFAFIHATSGGEGL